MNWKIVNRPSAETSAVVLGRWTLVLHFKVARSETEVFAPCLIYRIVLICYFCYTSIYIMSIRLTSTQKGIVFIVCSACFFTVMNVCVKLSGNLPSIQKAFFRNSIACLTSFVFLIKNKPCIWMPKKNIPILILRTVLGTAGLVANFYAVSHLALADASILAKLAPFFTIFFSFLFLGEHIRPGQLFAAVCAFAASFLIIKPTFAGSAHVVAACIACFGGLCAGGAYTCVRYLLTHKASGSFVIFFFSAVSMLMLLPFFISDLKPMSRPQLFFLIAAGTAGAGGQFSITAAYTYAPAKNIAVFDYTQILFASLFGFILFHEIPDVASIAGYLIICAIALILFFKKEGSEA